MPRAKTFGLMRDLSDLRARCVVKQDTHCWEWTGGMSRSAGSLAIYVFDYSRNDKQSVSGPRGAWMLAHGEAPRKGHMVFRSCGNWLCLNPAHLRQASGRAEIGEHLRRSGRHRGVRTLSTEHRERARQAIEQSGRAWTSEDLVLQIRAAPPGPTLEEFAERFGVSRSVVSRIRTGSSYKHL